MSPASIHYTKLPGPSAGWSGRTRLWLAEDHLLEVNSTLVTERYHRFFLHDIRSVIAQRTKTGFYWNVALASLAALVLALGGGVFWIAEKIRESEKVTAGDRTAVWVIAGIFGGAALFFLLLLVINTLFGPTCRFYIQTTAGSRLIASPTRLRRADRLLGKIIPHIESVQSLPPA